MLLSSPMHDEPQYEVMNLTDLRVMWRYSCLVF